MESLRLKIFIRLYKKNNGKRLLVNSYRSVKYCKNRLKRQTDPYGKKKRLRQKRFKKKKEKQTNILARHFGFAKQTINKARYTENF